MWAIWTSNIELCDWNRKYISDAFISATEFINIFKNKAAEMSPEHTSIVFRILKIHTQPGELSVPIAKRHAFRA